MTHPEWLDPRTLRYIADEYQREAADLRAHADFLRITEHQFGRAAEAHRVDGRAHGCGLAAKRLRALATRIERKRKQ